MYLSIYPSILTVCICISHTFCYPSKSPETTIFPYTSGVFLLTLSSPVGNLLPNGPLVLIADRELMASYLLNCLLKGGRAEGRVGRRCLENDYSCLQKEFAWSHQECLVLTSGFAAFSCQAWVLLWSLRQGCFPTWTIV